MAELQEDQNLYSLLLENVSDVIWILDLDTGRFRYVSPSVQRLRGYTPAEVLEQSLAEALTPDSFQYLQQVLPQRLHSFQQGQTKSYVDEIGQPCRDGTIVWTETTTRFFANDNTGHLEVYGVSRDISERKQAEETIRLKEELLQLTGEMAKVGGWEFDSLTLQGTWTDEVARIHELDPGQETNVELGVSFYVGNSREKIEQAIKEAIEKAQPYDLELELVTAKGKHKWVRSMGTPIIQNGRVVKVRGIFQDITERKETEQALRENEERLRLALTVSGMGVWERELQNDAVFWSPECYEIFGVEHFGGTLESFLDFIHPDDIVPMRSLVEQALVKKGSFVVEFRIIRPDGVIRWISNFGRVTYDACGQPLRLVGTVQDITERKLAEEALRQSEQKYRSIIESSVEGIMLVGGDGVVLEWNQAQEEITGLARSAALGQHIWEVQFSLALPGRQTPEVYERIKAFYHRLLKTGKKEMELARPLEQIIQHLNGEQRFVQGILYPIPTAQGFMLTGMFRDITDLKRTENVLRESEEWLRLAYEAGDLGTWRHDLTTGMLHLDARARTHFGFDAGAVLLADLLTRVHPDDLARLRQEIAASLDPASDEHYTTEYRIIHPGGAIRWVSIYGRVYFEGEGSERHPVLGVGTSQDITARKQAEMELKAERASLARRVKERTAELSRANAELAQAMRAKDEFLANMSHELRTPLNAILGLSESLQEEQIFGSLNEHQLKSVRTIEQSGHHLLELINDILDLAKIEAGKLELQPELVSVIDVCQASLAFVKETASKKNQQLSFDLSDWQVNVKADPRRLKQILVNLLSNAVKFTPVGGRVSLEVTPSPEEGAIRFAVQDNGIGIAAEDMAKLFKPFIQLDASLSRHFEGTGLGLALVRRLADLHGGSVSVESAGVPGQGSRFTLSLPWAGPAEITAKPPAQTTEGIRPLRSGIGPGATPPEKKGTILLAEDNEMSSEVVGDYLEYQGYQLIVARDGREALQQAVECEPDLILMDIQMPLLDGLQAIQQLRASSQFARTPIIALTALAMPGDRERCLAAGANDYITKPVSLKGLVATIEALLGG
ncbi:MAG: PAS domain S-box protein [Anaerolineae bacterium]|nr:PAS domain S-box protein [Anaerolineae bacterium]